MTKHTTISTLLTSPVVLGTSQYGPDLAITASGGVQAGANSAAAITGPATLGFARIDNAGTLTGGSLLDNGSAPGLCAGIALYCRGAIENIGTIKGGGTGGYEFGGLGILLAAGGEVTNAGTITGGRAGYYYASGTGVLIEGGGAVNNTGTIRGGYGYPGSNGGGGVSLTGAPGTVINSGTIAGANGAYYANGGIGVNLAAGGVVRNSGTISGGYGGGGFFSAGSGSTAVNLGAAGEVINTGKILGGGGAAYMYGVAPAGDGVAFAAEGTLRNAGTITAASYGGIGAAFSAGGTLINTGSILAGRYASEAVRFAAAGTVTNRGTITGGAGTEKLAPQAGAYLAAGGTLANWGLINANSGSYGGGYAAAGTGGTGVVLAGSAQAINHGTIRGGEGGQAYRRAGGTGGTGLVLESGATAVNAGTIQGGIGGIALGSGSTAGVGGVGVLIDGGTLIARNGIIAGGPAYQGHTPTGDAVQFTGAGTLVLYARTTISGNIAADPTASDTLVLAGATTGTLTGFGGTVTGFTTITEQSGTHWHLAGNIGGTGTLTIGAQGFLALSGNISIATLDFATFGHAALELARGTAITSTLTGFGPGDTIDLAGIAATTLHYHAGTLTLLNAAQQVVDTLHVAGDFKTADFALHAAPNGTEITYVGPGTAAETPPWHFGAAFAHALWTGHTLFPR